MFKIVMKYLVLSTIILSVQKNAYTQKEKEPEATCTFKNLGGTLPDDICYIREFLKAAKSKSATYEQNKKPSATDELYNAYIFHGKSGTGKTTTAKEEGTEADVVHDFHTAHEILNKIDESHNAHKIIAEIFTQAIQKSSKEPIVLIIDEIDELQRHDSKTAESFFAAIRSQLDTCKFNSSIVIILTSNNIKKLDYPMLRRCIQVKWSVPSADNRKAIIEFFAKKHGLSLSDKVLDSLQQETDTFTGYQIARSFYFGSTETGPLSVARIKRGIERVKTEIKESETTGFDKVKNFVKEHSAALSTITLGIIGVGVNVLRGKTGEKPPSNPEGNN